jgi:hypothetical protein
METATRDFSKAMDAAQALTGFNRGQIVLGSAGVVLKTCASRTKVATAQALQFGSRLRVLRGLQLTRGGPITINAGVKAPYGRVYLKKKDGSGYRRTHEANFKPLNQHYTNDQWAAIEAAIDAVKAKNPVAFKKAQQSAGLARQSWVLIADSLGIALETVAGGGSISAGAIHKAREARARNGAEINNGLSRKETAQGKFFVTLINRLPYGRRLGLDGMLQAVIAGHAKYFFTAVQKGYSGSLQETFKLFPGWTVRR